MQINHLLSQLRAMAAVADGKPLPPAEIHGTEGQDFAGLLKESVNKVNEAQQAAGKLATAFELGDPNVDLARVMIAMEKSNLSFQALTQVRNKLISAYQEIMSMQV